MWGLSLPLGIEREDADVVLRHNASGTAMQWNAGHYGVPLGGFCCLVVLLEEIYL